MATMHNVASEEAQSQVYQFIYTLLLQIHVVDKLINSMLSMAYYLSPNSIGSV